MQSVSSFFIKSLTLLRVFLAIQKVEASSEWPSMNTLNI